MHDEVFSTTRRYPRRRFLALTGGGLAAVALGAACGDDDDDVTPTADNDDAEPEDDTPTATSEPDPTATPDEESGEEADDEPSGTIVVGDVLDYALASEDWTGDFGFVTFQLHAGLVEGEQVYFIRTDASDQAFAEEAGLVFVPLMANALEADMGGYGHIYLVENGIDDQPAVLSTGPNMDDFTPAFQVHRVTFGGEPRLLESVADVEAATGAGEAEVEDLSVLVNYPVVKWPGGELPHDEAREQYLGDGQLLEPVDVDGMTVTFKLHACYPNSRYIVTDVTMPPMAGGMNIAPAAGAAALSDAGATAKILVFGNGVEGSGPMGFQKSVTDTVVGDPDWSPYWDHYTFVWGDDAEASVLKAEAEIESAEADGALERFNGTPDTDGQLFMVNCPVPVIAPIA